MPLDGSHFGEFEKISDAIQVIDRARKLVERGWTRDWYNHGRYCALGALTRVITAARTHELSAQSDQSQVMEHPATAAFCRAAGLEFAQEIVGWNDARESRRPVLDAFDKAHGMLAAQLALAAVRG